MTNHEFARKQIDFYTGDVAFSVEQMKYYREIIKKENAFIKEAQKEGYTFTTTKEKTYAEKQYNYYYGQKKHDEKMIAYCKKVLLTADYLLFED